VAEDPVTLNALGVELQAQGRLEESAASLRRALALAPGFADAHNNLGVVEQALGRLEQAERSLRHALEVDPGHAAAASNLGNVLQSSGRLEEAERSFRHALQCKPDYAAALSNLGSLLRVLGRHAEAMEAILQALRIDPAFAKAFINLGAVQRDLGRLADARQSLRRAIEIEPALAEAHNTLGTILLDCGEAAAAAESFAAATRLDPRHGIGCSNLAFALNCAPGRTAAEIHAAHRAYADTFCAPAGARAPHANPRDPGRRLRVGYVSGDLREHSVGHFFEPVLGNHDRAGFEIFCYFNHPGGDATSARLRAQAHAWRPTYALSDDALEALIRRDAIDLLVDLSGNTLYNRLPVFGRKPAPVQLTWLGFPGTTGLRAIDYRIADPHTCPEGLLEGCHSERLLRLPRCQWCYQPPSGSPAVGPPPSAASGAVAFGVFCNLAKVTDPAMALWSRLLERVPGSRLLLMGRGLRQIGADVLARFSRQGADPSRVELLEGRRFPDYLALHGSVDIVLDTLPYSGGTTTCHALWMGVPVVSLAGETPTSRSGASLLSAVGLEALVARSPEAYVDIAARLAQDAARLALLRSGMRERMLASPLMDAAGFTRALEEAYRSAWRRWCAAG
jgi:predicted O-linked N-acetylglucosamine transferase (SPINDLY family)